MAFDGDCHMSCAQAEMGRLQSYRGLRAGFAWLMPRLLGVLLLVTALLKLQGLGIAPVTAMGPFSAAWFQVLLIEGEIVLGLWLLSGVAQLACWTSTLVTFALFGAASTYLGLIGRTSCGCLGQVPLSPWVALGFDVIVLAGLCVGTPKFDGINSFFSASVLRPMLSAIATLVAIVGVSGLLISVAAYYYGSVEFAMAAVRGERLAVLPGVIDVGERESEEGFEFPVEFANFTSAPVRVVGGTADCGCNVLQILPVTVPPGESRSIPVVAQLVGPSGIVTRRASFLVVDGSYKRVQFVFHGRIR